LRGSDREEIIDEARQAPEKTILLSIVITAFVLVTVASLSILQFERHAPDANLRTGADAIWWALVSITTVGYGDYFPVTFAGRVLATILMVFGICIFAVLTSFVATRLIKLGASTDDIIEVVKRENAEIRAELDEIKKILKDE
jgi:voltage-gated potassium channel